MRIIATIHNDFNAKFGIPRQSGLVPEVESVIVFEPDYRNPDALRGLTDFSHLWLIWSFHQIKGKETVFKALVSQLFQSSSKFWLKQNNNSNNTN